jgi:serine/threonine protein kinase
MEGKLNVTNIIPKKLKLADYELGQTLGTGSFGRVKIAKTKSNGKYCAVKILKKAEIIKLKQVDHIMNEVRILSIIDHPFLVKFVKIIF